MSDNERMVVDRDTGSPNLPACLSVQHAEEAHVPGDETDLKPCQITDIANLPLPVYT